MSENMESELLLRLGQLEAENEALRADLATERSWRAGMHTSIDQFEGAVLTCGGDGAIRWVNLAACRLLGLAREEMLARSLSSLLSEQLAPRLRLDPDNDDAADIACLIRGYLEDPLAHSSIELFEPETGEWHSLWVQAFKGGTYGEGRILHITRITDFKRTERKLQESQYLLTSVLESLPCGVWVCDERGRYILQNPAAIEVWGDFRGKTVFELDLEDETRQEWVRVGMLAFSQGEIVRLEAEYEYQGTRRVFDQIVAPMIRDDKIVGVIGVHVDIEPLKSAEASLEAQRQETLRVESVARIASSIARDFERNLEAIHSWTNAAAQVCTTSEQEKINKAILEEIANASSLTSELINLTVPPSKELDLILIDDIIQDELSGLGVPTDTSPRVTFTTDGLSHLVRADAFQIRQLLEHLLENATRATSPPGEIRVSARKLGLRDPYYRSHPWVEPGEWTLLEVEDDGKGMSPNVRSRVFEPYFSTHPDRQGLGLAIVYSIVQRHGGHVSIDSTKGQGTRVDVLFPMNA